MLHAFGISNLKKPDATCLSCDHDILSRVHWCIYQTKYSIQLYSLTILYTNSLFLFFAVYITKQCGKSVNISEQNFVELSPATRPRITNTTCRLNLAPFTPNSNDSGLVLTIEHIGLSSKTSGACLNNRINIYDGTEKLSKFINYFSITPPPR